MVDLNYKIRILFFILSMILSVHGLEISILNVFRDFKCKTNIVFNKTNGQKIYDKTNLQPISFQPVNPNSIVIIHVVDENRFEDIANCNAFDMRFTLAQELFKHNYELIVLGFKCEWDEMNIIKDFIPVLMLNMNKWLLFSRQARSLLQMEDVLIEVENLALSGGTLSDYLMNSFPKIEYKSERTVLRKIKEVKFYDLTHTTARYPTEVTWPISVNNNGEYDPKRDLGLHLKINNVLRRYPNDTIHILIVSGEIYETIKRPVGSKKFKSITAKLLEDGHILCLMGCFNFEWSDIDLVRQIILKHSEKEHDQDPYNVFTIGIGMFETRFENPKPRNPSPDANPDTRCLLPTTNADLIEYAKTLYETCSSATQNAPKSLEIWDFKTESPSIDVNITLLNGQYEPQRQFSKFSLPDYPNVQFAFFVVDSIELHTKNIYSEYKQNLLASLESDGILVFQIKTSNFEYYDLHIIPEWIERHRGDIHPNRIAILGAGKFATTYYQYLSPLYQVLYTRFILPNEQARLQQVFVQTFEKAVRIFAFDSSNSKFQIINCRMHTINGIYDPIVLSANNIETRNEAKILFIIIEPNQFQAAINAPFMQDLFESILQAVRKTLAFCKDWIICLTCLDNFEEYDSHLFAEFVKIHTNDKRSFHEFIFTYKKNIGRLQQPKYVYKDEKPFIIAKDRELQHKLSPLIAKLG